MQATERYELIRLILEDGKTVKAASSETGFPTLTLYYYLTRFKEGNRQLESLTDESIAIHIHHQKQIGLQSLRAGIREKTQKRFATGIANG